MEDQCLHIETKLSTGSDERCSNLGCCEPRNSRLCKLSDRQKLHVDTPTIDHSKRSCSLTMGLRDAKTHASTFVPKDVIELIRRLYDCLDDPARVDGFAETFTPDGTLKVQGTKFQGIKGELDPPLLRL